MTRSTRPFPALAAPTAALLLAAFAIFPATAFQQPASKPTAVPASSAPAPKPAPVPAESSQLSTPTDPKDVLVEFSQEVLTIPSAGLTVSVPAGCAGSRTEEPVPPEQAGRAMAQVALQILPSDMSEAWSVTIRAPRLGTRKLTASQCADDAFTLLKQRMQQAAANQQGIKSEPRESLRLIERVPNEQDPRKHLMGGREHQVEFVRWYAQAPQDNGRDDVVRGLVVAQVTENQFITFDLTTTEAQFPAARRMFENIVAFSTLRDPSRAIVDKGEAIRAGIDLKKGLTDATLKTALEAKKELWLRLYKPSAQGGKQNDTEVGYICYQFGTGQRGMVDRAKPKSTWGETERESGYLIFSDIRYFEGDRIVDSQAGYFLRTDRAGEFWSVEMAIRDPKFPKAQPDVFREMGVREDLSMQIETSSTGGGDKTIKPIMRSADEYISRVESLLVPQLLVKAQTEAEYAYYTWNPDVGKIQLRRDTVARSPLDSTQWRLTTRYGDGETAQTSYYANDGTFIRTETAKGLVLEPSTLDELEKLWKSKGLPVGSLDKKPAK